MKVATTENNEKQHNSHYVLVRNFGVQATLRCLVRDLLYGVMVFSKFL